MVVLRENTLSKIQALLKLQQVRLQVVDGLLQMLVLVDDLLQVLVLAVSSLASH